MLKNSLFVIERARPEEAAALLDYLKIIGEETDNLSFGAEGVPLSIEEEQAYLRAQCDSADKDAIFLTQVRTNYTTRHQRKIATQGGFFLLLFVNCFKEPQIEKSKMLYAQLSSH